MAVDIIITLTSVGIDQGNLFDLYSNVDGFNTPYETSVPLSSLQTGHITSAPDGTITVKVCGQQAQCSNCIDINPTYTTTTTTTIILDCVLEGIIYEQSIPTTTTTTTILDCNLEGVIYEYTEITTTTTTTTLEPTTTTTTTVAPVTTTTTTTEEITTTTTTTNAIVACLDGLVIETFYFGSADEFAYLPEGIIVPDDVQAGGHGCNRAYFEVYGNANGSYTSTSFMAPSRLNNMPGDVGVLATNYLAETVYVCQDYANGPDALATGSWSSNSRYDKTIISNSKALEIASLGTSETEITISYISGYETYNTTCTGGAVPHSDINWLRITNSSGQILHNSGVVGGDISTIDVCSGTDPVAPSVGLLSYNAVSEPCAETPTTIYYGNTSDFSHLMRKTGKLYTSPVWNGSSFTKAPTGYYSDGLYWRFWDATLERFTSSGECSVTTTTTTTTVLDCVLEGVIYEDVEITTTTTTTLEPTTTTTTTTVLDCVLEGVIYEDIEITTTTTTTTLEPTTTTTTTVSGSTNCSLTSLLYSTISGDDACDNGTENNYYVSHTTEIPSALTMSGIYTDAGCSIPAPSGYYSLDLYNFYWNGTTMGVINDCPGM